MDMGSLLGATSVRDYNELHKGPCAHTAKGVP